MVVVNFLTWGCAITNPSTAKVQLKPLYSSMTLRNRGICGYNTTGYAITPAIDTDNIFFTNKKDPSTEEVAWDGTSFNTAFGNGTFQMQLWYLTNE